MLLLEKNILQEHKKSTDESTLSNTFFSTSTWLLTMGKVETGILCKELF